MRGGYDGQGEGEGEGHPCDLWHRLVSLGVTMPQLRGARGGPLRTHQQSGGCSRGEGLPRPVPLRARGEVS